MVHSFSIDVQVDVNISRVTGAVARNMTGTGTFPRKKKLNLMPYKGNVNSQDVKPRRVTDHDHSLMSVQCSKGLMKKSPCLLSSPGNRQIRCNTQQSDLVISKTKKVHHISTVESLSFDTKDNPMWLIPWKSSRQLIDLAPYITGQPFKAQDTVKHHDFNPDHIKIILHN